MIIHVFNSSVVSGPETLVLPALLRLGRPVAIVFLVEERLAEKSLGPVKYAQDLGHIVRTVNVRGRWDPSAFKELRRVLDSLNPSIVHAHDVKASLYLLKAARKKPFLSAKLVSTHHGAAARRGKIRLYEEYYVRRILPKFDAALYVCKADYLSLKRRGLRDSLLYLHHNGVDRTLVPVSVRTAAQEEIRDRWRNIAPGLPQSSGAIYVGAVARLSWEKRHDRMLNVLKNVNAIGLKLPVVLLNFGIGEDEAKLREQAKRLGIESQVFWMGYSKTISQEISGLDLLLCLSDGEGIPINLLEAGWSGTPVFSTSVGGIPDLISNPHLGYLVDKSLSDEQISSDMARALRDTAQLRRVGEKFQEHVVRNFSETAWLERLKAIYREVLLGPQLK